MNPRILFATATRVLSQIRHDHRTIVMLLVVPCVLLWLLQGIFSNRSGAFDRVGAPLLGLFPFIVMFLITSITMLRERTSGTLERLMTTPMSKLDLLLGYGLAFALLAAIQAAVVSAFAFLALDLDVAGSRWAVGALAIVNAVLGMAFGLCISAFARSEFQAVQFMPAIVIPQLLLCGLIVPRALMTDFLDAAASFLPLTYAFEALQGVALTPGADVAGDVLIVCSAIVVLLALGALTLRRRTA